MPRVVHYEIHAVDLERAKKFYQDVFGWEMQQMGEDFGNYVVIKSGPSADEIASGKAQLTLANIGINGGMMMANAPRPPKGVGPNAYVCVIGVDNIDTYIERCKAAGAEEHMPKTDIPGVGKVAYFQDLEGNLFGMLEPAPMQ